MAIATPTALTITDESGFLLPPMAAGPLHTALNNSNYLYLQHTPALVSVCPITATSSRDRAFLIPIFPSADGLPYSIQHRILAAFNGTVTIRVEWAETVAGAFTTVYGPTATFAMVTGVWHMESTRATIDSRARVLRVTYTAAVGAFRLGHILSFPFASVAAVPFVAPFGQTSSGFRVYEDSLLYAAGVAGQPVNTEMLDRCRRNSVKVLQDRRQMVFSLVQDGPGAAVIYPTIAAAAGFATFGHVRFTIPPLAKGAQATLQVYVIASVSAGTTADLVKVTVGTATVSLAADGVLNAASLTVYGDTHDVRVTVGNTAGNATSLRACVGFWQPGV